MYRVYQFFDAQERRVFLNKNDIFDWSYKPYYDASDPSMLNQVEISRVSQEFFLQVVRTVIVW